MNLLNILKPHKLAKALRIECRTLNQILLHGQPDVCLHFLGGLGDEVMLTCLAREMKKRDPKIKIWQISDAKELFHLNPDYTLALGRSFWELRHSNILKSKRTRLGYSNRINFEDNWTKPKEHILVDSLRKAGLKGQVALRPYVYLSNTEIDKYRLFDNQICIQSVGEKTHETWMKNKLWFHERFLDVVRQFRHSHPHIKFVQLGSHNDPDLGCDADLRGKNTLRETAAILAASKLFVGTQGFLSHLARAVDTRSVVIFGGREHAWQSGYIANINLQSSPSCAPCWSMSRCDHDRMCMKQISVEDVCEAIRYGLSLYGQDLPVEIVNIE